MDTEKEEARMQLVDSHTHLYAEEFDGDRADMMARALAGGVDLMLLPATSAADATRQDALKKDYPDHIGLLMGLHPTELTTGWEEQLLQEHRLLFAQPDHYVGVGEVGLDFYWDSTYRDAQLQALRQQLLWAIQLDKPLSIHLRSAKDGSDDAYETFFQLLASMPDADRLRGVLHCFSGTVEQAKRGIAAGFHIGIGGVVTYKKSLMAEVATAIPLEHIVLETDAPYLAPVPHRGKRNEAAFLPAIANHIAALKQRPVQEVASVTTATAKRLFGTA